MDKFGELSSLTNFYSVSLILLFCLSIIQTWFIIQLLKQHGRILNRIDAIENDRQHNNHKERPSLLIGQPAPQFKLANIDGLHVSLSDLRSAGKPICLLFTDTNCSPYNAMIPSIASWQKMHSDKVTFAIVAKGNKSSDSYATYREYRLKNMLLQEDREVTELYFAYGTPSALIISKQGDIVNPLVMGVRAISTLIDELIDT